MPVQINKQIDVLKKTLIKKFGAKQIIIFGSHAYGKADDQSDIDLCVITDLNDKRKSSLSEK